MLAYKIVTVIALVLLAIQPLYHIARFIPMIGKGNAKREKRIAFLRGFKKGKCAIVYITAVPLYFIGHLFAGMNVIDSFLVAVSKIIGLVVLGFDSGSVSALMAADGLYNFTIYFCYVLVFINAILLTVSITEQYIWCRINSARAVLGKKEKLIIFGNNEKSEILFESAEGRRAFIVDDISDEAADALYKKGTEYISTRKTGRLINKMLASVANDAEGFVSKEKKLLSKISELEKKPQNATQGGTSGAKSNKNETGELTALRSVLSKLRADYDSAGRRYVFIVNNLNDEKNIDVCRAINARIAEEPEAVREVLYRKVAVFVFGDRSYDALYQNLVREGCGCLHYLSRHRIIASDLVDRYPISSFMDERHIDTETSLVNKEVDINAVLIGYGDTNQQILMTSVANNQFITAGASEPTLKLVNYYVLDKEEGKSDKSLNHYYNRFEMEMKGVDEDKYLPLPSKPAEIYPIKHDVNDKDYYTVLREILTKNPLSVNIIVVSYGTDLENMDMARKLIEKKHEWGVENLTVFVKVRSWSKEETVLSDPSCIFIGGDREVVYNVERVLDDKLFNMAKQRNEIYSLEYKIKHEKGFEVSDESYKKNADEARHKWYFTFSEWERESNLFGVLSLRSKLQMMGLDYCPVDDKRFDGIDEYDYNKYIEKYAGEDKPRIGEYKLKAGGKDIVSYSLDFAPSRRRNLAIQEHLRWNSFMISKGFVSADKETILGEQIYDAEKKKWKYSNGKNYAVRRHGNLTTFEGLVEFRKMLAQREEKRTGEPADEASYDVIMYDYQLLDDAYWLLSTNGFKIVSKEKKDACIKAAEQVKAAHVSQK